VKITVGKEKIECQVAWTEFQKAKGLMFRKEIRPLLFPFRREKKYVFHTLFMRKPIDIVYLDSKKTVVEKKLTKPWKFWIQPNTPARYILELPKGLGKKFKLGKKVRF